MWVQGFLPLRLIVLCLSLFCLHGCSCVVIWRGCCNPGLSDAQIDLHGEIMQCLSVCEMVVGILHCICWICSDSDLASISSLLASILPLSARMHCCHPASQHSDRSTKIRTHSLTHSLTHAHTHTPTHWRFLSSSHFYSWHVDIHS